MRSAIKVILANLVVAGSALASGSSDHAMPPFKIPELSDISIDGVADDWKGNGFKVAFMADDQGDRRPSEDFDPKLMIGWDHRGLLLYISVRDDGPEESSNVRRMFEADSFEVFVGTSRELHDYYMTLVGPGRQSTAETTTPPVCFFDERAGGLEAARNLADLEGQFARTLTPEAAGYEVELLLPWKNLGITPEEGKTFSFQFYAMDKDPGQELFRVAWFPQFDTHENETRSMYTLELSDGASPPVNSSAGGNYRRVAVAASRDLVNEHVRVLNGEKLLAASKLAAKDGHAFAELTLPPPMAGAIIGSLDVQVGGRLIARTHRSGQAAMLSKAIHEGELTFFRHVFVGTRFPTVEFKYPEVVDELVGGATLKIRWFDEGFREVYEAAEGGRYGAVVEVTPAHGRISRRFFTLYRDAQDDRDSLAQSIPPWIIEGAYEVELPGGLKLESKSHENRSTGFTEADAIRRAATDPSEPGVADIEDQRWWIGLKRQLYDLGHKAACLPLPEIDDNTPATVVIPGRPSEAGLNSGITASLEDICARWMKEADRDGFILAISKNGVMFFNKAYGISPSGKPMTTETPSEMSSITKMLTGIAFLMFVDRGLVEVDAPIGDTLSSFSNVPRSERLTHRMLLTHTSGLRGHYGDEFRDLEERIADDIMGLEIPSARIYNGKGFALSMKAMEMISGEPHTVLLSEMLLKPLEMDNTQAFNSHNDAVGTASDFLKVGQMLLNGGAYGPLRFFSRETLALGVPKRLTEIFGDDAVSVCGLGFSGSIAGRGMELPAYGHPGGNSAVLRVDPSTGFVISVSSFGDRKVLSGELLEELLSALKQSVVKTNEYGSETTNEK